MFRKAILLLSVIGSLLSACQPGNNSSTPTGKDSLSIRQQYANSPVIPASESISKMQVEEGLTVKLVAAEPLVVAPVALTFDDKGRLWVVEMQGYMPDTVGTGEEQPTGKIVILEDKNKDGVMDDRKVFLDSLVLPRAICLMENGILVAEPPKLWFVEINNDKPGKKTLVDEKYAEGGNVEHQPNGLLRSIDNWIYNAKSAKRYKKKGDRWLIKPTHFRGQWGLSQDDYGRLYYNHNSANVLGDYFFPSLGATNKNQEKVSGFNEKIVGDNRVYPARATTGVNRAYQKGILDSNLRLVYFTAACGPLVYRGNLLGDAYYGNAFVPEPSANLIKRNIIEEDGYVVKGKQAYEGKEFLASTDERFRPVNIYNAPDGALYVLDMYRGIIQHKTYLTEYLKNEIRQRGLTQPLSCGRIYKIVPANKQATATILPTEPMELLKLLEHPNGWVRDKAQQLIIDKKYIQLAPALRHYLSDLNKPIPLVHALWTLKEFDALQSTDIIPLLQQPNWRLRMSALSVLPEVLTKKNYREYLPALQQLLNRKDTLAAPVIAYLVPFIQPLDKAAAGKLLLAVATHFPNNRFVADAVISNLQDKEAAFIKSVPDTTLVIHKQLRKVLANIAKSKNDAGYAALAKKYPEGFAAFKSICQTCHGADGNGMPSLAPPLNGSEWVTGDKEKLMAIVLYGLTGPIQVNDKLYKAPEITADMPGIGNNKELNDEEIAQLLSFIRHAWSNKASDISPADIDKVRKKYGERQKAFTMEELNKK